MSRLFLLAVLCIEVPIVFADTNTSLATNLIYLPKGKTMQGRVVRAIPAKAVIEQPNGALVTLDVNDLGKAEIQRLPEPVARPWLRAYRDEAAMDKVSGELEEISAAWAYAQSNKLAAAKQQRDTSNPASASEVGKDGMQIISMSARPIDPTDEGVWLTITWRAAIKNHKDKAQIRTVTAHFVDDEDSLLQEECERDQRFPAGETVTVSGTFLMKRAVWLQMRKLKISLSL